MKDMEIKKNPEKDSANYAYWAVIRIDKDGPELTRERINHGDIDGLYSETWLMSIRKGFPDVPFSNMTWRVLPNFNPSNRNVCSELIVESTSPNGDITRCQFDTFSLYSVAMRAFSRLDLSVSIQGIPLYYDIVAEPCSISNKNQTTEHSDMGQFTVRHKPLIYRTLPIEPLLASAKTFGDVQGWIPVFYSENLLNKADRLSRRGATCRPPEETGAVILGYLCSCPNTGEFYVVASEVIELMDAQNSPYTLTYSAKTWACIQSQIKSRRSSDQSERMVGQCHGHNFPPTCGEINCRDCRHQNTCDRSTLFVSEEDFLWSQAVFARQPWAFCHIFGLNSRYEKVQGLFGFRGGRLIRRGFYIIDETNLD